MNNHGFCLAYRNAWTHPVFNNLREASIWNFLYQNAFYEDGEANFNGYTFSLKRGQIIVSTSFLAKGFCMSEKGIRVVIQKLEKHQMLVKQGASRGTIITICNYDKYQLTEKTKGKRKGNRGASRGRAEGDNNKEVKNKEGKEGNKEEGKKVKVSLDELSVDHIKDWLADKRIQGKYFNHDEYHILEVFKNYCESKGAKYANYIAAYRNAFEWKQFQQQNSGYNNQPTADDNVTAGIQQFLSEDAPQQGY